MKFLAGLFLIASIVSLVLSIIVRLFIHSQAGILGFGVYSFFSFSMAWTIFVTSSKKD